MQFALVARYKKQKSDSLFFVKKRENRTQSLRTNLQCNLAAYLAIVDSAKHCDNEKREKDVEADLKTKPELREVMPIDGAAES